MCICGSTRFRDEISDANRRLTLAGKVVLAPGVFAHDGDVITEAQKDALDRLHFEKINLADEVYVVNPGGYIGESTRREITYAQQHHKLITYSDDTARDLAMQLARHLARQDEWFPPTMGPDTEAGQLAEPCPECKAGKHTNCDHTTWSDAQDGPVDCPCWMKGH